MKAYKCLLALIVGLLLFATGATAVAADSGIIVSSNAPVLLLVDGVLVDKLPTTIAAGSRVSVAETVHYTTEEERWVFQGWRPGTKDETVTLSEPGVYQALYAHQVLLHVRSAVGELQNSMWATYGSLVAVEVPQIVEASKGVRYRFQQWSEGETPFLARNSIAPLKPTTLEAKWVKEYLITIIGASEVPLPGSGWYGDGSSLVVQAPEVISGQSQGERLSFAAWETVGIPIMIIPNAKAAINTIRVDAPYTLRAVYEKQYWVVAGGPSGTLKREWVTEGGEVVLDTPAVIDLIPEQERLVFKKWEGMEGLFSPKVSGQITAPVNLTAVYERQAKLTVSAPYGGTGDGWYKEGSTATVSVPVSDEQSLFVKRQFIGFPGYASGQPTIQVLVKEPMVVTAIYRSSVNLGVLALLISSPLLAILIYFVGRRMLLLVPWRRALSRKPGGEVQKGGTDVRPPTLSG